MKFTRLFVCLSLIVAPCHAAVSILVEPGSTSSTTFFTVTQTSPNPLLNVGGIVGYASGIEVPTAMFAVGGSNSPVTDIFGVFGASIATVTESVSGETFSLTGVRIVNDPSLPSAFGFDRLSLLSQGTSAIQFEMASSGAVETSIPASALNPGTYTIEDVLFGTVTVTVLPESFTAVPEPSGLVLFGAGTCLLVARRRRRK